MKIINRKLLFTSIIGLLLFNFSAYAYKNTYAIIIGVADYKYMEEGNGDLTWTINDAYKMAHFLMSKEGGSVPQQNIHMFLDDDASKSDILYYSKKLFAKAQPGDRVIFYFSGHGQKGAFVPYDADGSGSKMLYFNELKEVFREADCETKLLIADACFAGSLKSKAKSQLKSVIEKELKSSTYKSIGTKETKQNIVVMLSCKDDQTSLEYGSLQQGIFTYTVIKGLSGYADKNNNKKITIKELFYYVYDNTKKLASQANNHLQTPVLFGNFDLNLIVGRIYN